MPLDTSRYPSDVETEWGRNVDDELMEWLRPLLWDCDPATVTWEHHRDFLVRRVLARGSWEQVRRLRRLAGDDVLREVLQRARGRFLERRQLRFWEIVLDLPRATIEEWLGDDRRRIWDGR